jgi:glycosyltransferase involved in cell wall biosynthesis
MKIFQIPANSSDRDILANPSMGKGKRMDWAVVIPVRNRPDLLARCLGSLQKQEFPQGEWEVLICDDGSRIDLSPVVERFRSGLPNLRILRQPSKGPAAARNMGFRASDASNFVCLDSDMTIAANFLTLLMGGLEKHPEWVATEGKIIPIGGEESPLWDAPTNEGGNLLSGVTAYRAHALKLAGGFDETFSMPANEDFEIGIRLKTIGTFGYLPDAVAYHPRRRITLATFWRWRRFWRFTFIIAKRYGVFGVPSRRKTTHNPRLRTAFAALLSMPIGRLRGATKYIIHNPFQGLMLISYAIFEFFCGICALPEIMFSHCPERRNYLTNGVDSV